MASQDGVRTAKIIFGEILVAEFAKNPERIFVTRDLEEFARQFDIRPTNIGEIIKRSSKILKIDIHNDAIKAIASRSRFTPRTANYFLKRCRDYAQIEKKSLSQTIVE